MCPFAPPGIFVMPQLAEAAEPELRGRCLKEED
jgi:hypothetical protein